MLPPETDKAWKALKEDTLLSGGILVGGTALTLQIQHRISEDIDILFPTTKLPRQKLQLLLNKLNTEGWKVEPNDNPAALDEFGSAGMELADFQQDFLLNGKTKLSFFVSDEHTQRLIESKANVSGVRIAGLTELFALKAVLTSQRSKSRDWLDLYLLMRHHGFTIHDYAAAYAKAEMTSALETGLTRLCSGTPSSADEGYFSLLKSPPSLEEMATYFRQQRDLYEQHLAAVAIKSRSEVK